MNKKLNTSAMLEKMMQLGISQADLAQKLDVSRTAVTAWLKPEKFPRPRHLLKLAEILQLQFDDLVVRPISSEPKVAFRKSGNHKIKPEHIERFQFSARLLERLVPLLPFDKLSAIPTLKNPSADYEYLEESASVVRSELGLTETEIKFEEIVGLFNKYNAVLIPVLWGKTHFKNATHIFLPGSDTTWIFINLDVKVFDFKFWLAHELGHAKAPQLVDQEGEDFADGFAGALLFPRSEAKLLYDDLIAVRTDWKRFDAIAARAEELVISPITLYKQLEAYAKHAGMPSLELENVIYRGTAAFNKKYHLLSKGIFSAESPSAVQLIEFAKDGLGTCFFEVLSSFVAEHDSPTKFIANLLDVSIEDAVALHRELVDAPVQSTC